VKRSVRLRSLRLLVVALAASGLLAACGDEATSIPAAVVNGVEISQQELVDELEAIEGNTEYLEAYEANAAAQGREPIRGEEDGSFNTAFVAETLAIRMQYAFVQSEVAARGIEPDEACVDAAEAAVAERFAGASASGDGQAIIDGFDDAYVEYLIDREADFFALRSELGGQACGEGSTDEAVAAYFDEHESELAVETACVSHILVGTQAEADELSALLAGGGDFAQLASERSIDTGSGANGGSLGCGPRGQYVEEFEAAVTAQPIGEVGPPVQSEFGFHLIRVDERGVQTLDDVRPDIEAALDQEVQQAFTDWFLEALAAGEVELDPRYGTWDPTQAIIVRPTSEG